MLQEIRIQNLGVIDDAVLELHPGLTVLTGETGAGKTMVVSGLGLLLGARADVGLVRAGAGSAVVEGLVDVPPDHPAARRAAEAGADVRSGLVLVRTVSAEGRSRAYVGGRSAPIGLLAELAEHLVAVHGQADQWRLRRADQHREVLDAFAGDPLAKVLGRYQQCYDDVETVRRETERLRALSRERAREVEVLKLGLEQIEAVDPQPGEDAALRVESKRLGHAEELRLAAETARVTLSGADDGYAAQAPPGVAEMLSSARSALAGVVERDPDLLELERRLAELGYLAADLGSDLAGYAAGVELDPERLAWVEQRRADLAGLLRKYGDSAQEVLDWSRDAAVRLDELLGADDRLVELEQRTASLRSELAALAAQLTAVRARAAEQLASRIGEELRHLAMGKATVQLSIIQRPQDGGLPVPGHEEPLRWARHGVDDVELLLAANAGAAPRSVAKAASGGELSRVMLAIEVATAAAGSSVPTFVFDEVDAGVGGRAALHVGARLAALARHAQVVVVTHLAQVAAHADRHLVVHKANDGHVTSSGVVTVEGEDRVRELGRMLGGIDSEAALQHARELLTRTAAAARGSTD